MDKKIFSISSDFSPSLYSFIEMGKPTDNHNSIGKPYQGRWFKKRLYKLEKYLFYCKVGGHSFGRSALSRSQRL
jgi:hypothetical protein